MQQAQRIPQEEEEALWTSWTRERSPQARATLVDRYLGVAKSVATGMYAKRIDDALSYEDYVHFAIVGLLESVDRFDPHKDFAFTTYAVPRMRGEILNAIKKFTEKADFAFSIKRSQKDRISSLAEHAGAYTATDPAESFAALASVAVHLAMGFMLEAGESDLSDSTHARYDYGGQEVVELKDLLKRMLEHLPDPEKKIVEYHYLHDLSFTTIADVLALSKGRVSQLHARALSRLRERLQAQNLLDKSF